MGTVFHKMHGLGNDFVLFDARTQVVDMTPKLARALANRHLGVGCDQLLVLEPSGTADIRMRIYNADGGEVEACGNASRAVAVYLGKPVRMETLGGVVQLTPKGQAAEVEMPAPQFGWEAIPLSMPMDTLHMPVAWDALQDPAAVNMGNPHVVFFVEDVDGVPLEQLGSRIEHDPLFPARVNVNVAQIMAANHVKLRVWERGVGETLACGTGACATAVAALRRRLVSSPVTVSLKGGDLQIVWQEGAPVLMSGAATHVFSGEIDLEALR
jgi:diaminopimelate epimerase